MTKSSGRPKKPKLIVVRRVVGDSMTPTLNPGQLVIGTNILKPRLYDIVIVRHQGLEKIKRISKIEVKKVFVSGDNPHESTDSRHFGWLTKSSIVAKVVWPR